MFYWQLSTLIPIEHQGSGPSVPHNRLGHSQVDDSASQPTGRGDVISLCILIRQSWVLVQRLSVYDFSADLLLWPWPCFQVLIMLLLYEASHQSTIERKLEEMDITL